MLRLPRQGIIVGLFTVNLSPQGIGVMSGLLLMLRSVPVPGAKCPVPESFVSLIPFPNLVEFRSIRIILRREHRLLTGTVLLGLRFGWFGWFALFFLTLSKQVHEVNWVIPHVSVQVAVTGGE